jgi:uncharacterized protein (TIGR03083 family)
MSADDRSVRSTGGSTMTTPVPVEDIRPITRPESVALARTETARTAALLRSLSDDQWSRATDCAAWDVRALAGHVLGMTETFSGLRPFVRNMRAGAREAGTGPFIDGLTAVQVRAHAALDSGDLMGRLEDLGPVQARWRGRRRLMRAIPITQQWDDGTVETWRLSYLVDVVLTRDTWMHRVDLARATGHALELTAGHDGRIVADVVAEWARRHGRPFTLALAGPAGGRYARDGEGPALALDAVEFCRILSGRAAGDGLLGERVPF